MTRSGTLEQICLEMYRDTAYEEEIKLLKKVQQLQIPFAGIDADRKTFEQQTTAAAFSEIAYRDNELIRINTMVHNIFIQIAQHFQTGGVLFISVGRNHAHRLAANLLHQAKTKNLDFAIQVHAFSMQSKYAEEFAEGVQRAAALTASLDSPDIQAIHQALPLQITPCFFQDNTFIAPLLETTLQHIIESSQPLQAPQTSIFQQLSPHYQLIMDIQHYLKTHPAIVTDKDLITAIEAKNYALGLRKACAYGNTELVKIILNYRKSLAINMAATSANGNTPLMWFTRSKATPSEKDEISALLRSLEDEMDATEDKTNRL